jgi:excisionase family DNA binding protein
MTTLVALPNERETCSDEALLGALITATEAAVELRVHPVTILRWAREGRIPHLRLGRKVLFSSARLMSWLSSNTLVAPFVSPNQERKGA